MKLRESKMNTTGSICGNRAGDSDAAERGEVDNGSKVGNDGEMSRARGSGGSEKPSKGSASRQLQGAAHSTSLSSLN